MKHWVFDLDNTLVHSFPHYLESLEHVLQAYGHSLGTPNAHELASLPATKIFGRFLPDSEIPKALEVLRDKALEETHLVPAFSGVTQILSHLEDAGSSISIWTNRDLRTTEAVLQASGLRRYFHEVVSATCVSNPKPSPEGIRLLASRLKIQPEEMIMVGDHDFDIHGGKAAGAKTIRAGWSELVQERCGLADHHFHTIDELMQWMKLNIQ